MPTPSQHHVSIPWGPHQHLPLDLPAHWPAPSVHDPNTSNTLSDYPAALEAALAHPVESPRLEQLLEPGTKVALIVDDPSRWTPVRHALPILLARLHAAGIPHESISISVGVGRHAAVTNPAMRLRLGDTIVDHYTCHSPPLDDATQYLSLGTTPEGVPVRVFRPVAEAGLRILVGSVLPHLQAGFGGGYKLIFPGCSHRETLGALHRQGFTGHAHDAARLLGSDIHTNPMRRAITNAAALLPGINLSLSHALGAPGQLFRVVFGDVSPVQALLSNEIARRFRVDLPASASPADLVIAGNFPWPGDPMMSFKTLLNHRAAGRPGGALVGLFWTDPDELDRSLPLGPLRALAATGRPGGWLLRRGLRLGDSLATLLLHPSRFMIRWARELVADRSVLVYSPTLRQRLGPHLGPVQLFDDLHALWSNTERALRRPPASTRIFPAGGLTYCPAH